jgi:hypothetical protein
MLKPLTALATDLKRIAYAGSSIALSGNDPVDLENMERCVHDLRKRWSALYDKMQEKEVPRRDRG